MSFVFDSGMIRSEVEARGYVRVPGFVSRDDAAVLMADLKAMEAHNYTEENLATNAALYSDSTPTRVSHAMMISLEPSDLPTVPIVGALLKKLFEAHNAILAGFFGHPIDPRSRSMLNFQWYLGASKRVAEHFDGHYMQYQRLSPTEFKLEEGILPRYVFVITLENHNVGFPQGTHLRDTQTGEWAMPASETGDLLIFDNIRFRHSVPELSKPRVMVGFRCFDEEPLHFAKDPADKAGYRPLLDAVNPGFIRDLSTDDARTRLESYYRDMWPEHYHEMKKGGGLF